MLDSFLTFVYILGHGSQETYINNNSSDAEVEGRPDRRGPQRETFAESVDGIRAYSFVGETRSREVRGRMNFKLTILASGKTEFFATYQQAWDWACERFGLSSVRIEEFEAGKKSEAA